MRDIPMMFSPPMVQGLLAERKLETRRFDFKGQPGDRIWVKERWAVGQQYDALKPTQLVAKGMTVFFYAGGSIANDMQGAWKPDPWPRTYADRPDWCGKSRPSMYTPKWATRLTLLVTEVRREPLWAIDDAGAEREGIVQDDGSAEGGNPWYLPGSHFLSGVDHPKAHPIGQHDNPRDVYRDLWVNLNGLETWEANPTVSVICFRPVLMNVEDEELAYHAQA